MDAVITYVNGLDPSWREDYRRFVGRPLEEKRFRDWGTLRYLLRGIEACMPFIGKVHLVVSGESQVPEWADREKVHVVLHSDIIPGQFLPVFNSCTIEMFLHRIPGLAEEFIYFNDDMFPLQESAPEDFFTADGKICMGFSRGLLSAHMYKKQCRVSSRLARKASGKGPGIMFLRPQHIVSPMLASASREAYAAVREDILATSSRMRTDRNPNQYFYLDYLYFRGRAVDRRISCKHLSQAVYGADDIAAFIREPSARFACINDVLMSDGKFRDMRGKMLAAFEARFPEKSRFEL